MLTITRLLLVGAVGEPAPLGGVPGCDRCSGVGRTGTVPMAVAAFMEVGELLWPDNTVVTRGSITAPSVVSEGGEPVEKKMIDRYKL